MARGAFQDQAKPVPSAGGGPHDPSDRWLRRGRRCGGFAAAVGAGAIAGVLTKDSRGGVDVATSLFGRVGGPLGNIKVDVTGEEHAIGRPAVFFINHQSTLIDALVTSRVVQRGFTVVAKAELKQVPVLGQLLSLADVAFVDRANTSKAISAR